MELKFHIVFHWPIRPRTPYKGWEDWLCKARPWTFNWEMSRHPSNHSKGEAGTRTMKTTQSSLASNEPVGSSEHSLHNSSLFSAFLPWLPTYLLVASHSFANVSRCWHRTAESHSKLIDAYSKVLSQQGTLTTVAQLATTGATKKTLKARRLHAFQYKKSIFQWLPHQ